jgi:hypothetical protein
MKSTNRRHFYVTFLKALALPAIAAACVGSASAAVGDRSPDGVWVEVDRSVLANVTAPLPTEFRVYRVDLPALKNVLMQAPMENLTATAVPSPVILFLPLPDGMFAPTGVVKSPIMSAALQTQYPSIKTYAVRGVVDPSLIGRLTETMADFQALLQPSSLNAIRLSPIKTPGETFYISFLNRLRTDGADFFIHQLSQSAANGRRRLFHSSAGRAGADNASGAEARAIAPQALAVRRGQAAQ